MEGVRGRKSGFRCPLSCQQVGIWINTGTTILSTVACLIILISAISEDIDDSNGHKVIPYIEALIMAFLTTIFVISLGITIYLAYKCSVANTTDVVVIKQILCRVE